MAPKSNTVEVDVDGRRPRLLQGAVEEDQAASVTAGMERGVVVLFHPKQAGSWMDWDDGWGDCLELVPA